MELAAEGVVTMNESRTGNRLRGFNAGMALLHAAQGAVILALSNGVTVPIQTSFPIWTRVRDSSVFCRRIGTFRAVE